MKQLAAVQDIAWFCVQTSARAEGDVAEALKRKGFVSYAPRTTKWVSPQGRRTKVERPLFPTYLFVQLDRRTRPIYEVKKTDGVVAVLPNLRDALEVPAGLIANLQSAELAGLFDEVAIAEAEAEEAARRAAEEAARLAAEAEAARVAPLPKPGTPVKVMAGAVGDLAAQIVAAPSRRRIEILFMHIQTNMRVTTGVANLRAQA